jgi:hypothetical protein
MSANMGRIIVPRRFGLLTMIFSASVIVVLGLNEKTYNVSLEAPSTSMSIYAQFVIGG